MAGFGFSSRDDIDRVARVVRKVERSTLSGSHRRANETGIVPFEFRRFELAEDLAASTDEEPSPHAAAYYVYWSDDEGTWVTDYDGDTFEVYDLMGRAATGAIQDDDPESETYGDWTPGQSGWAIKPHDALDATGLEHWEVVEWQDSSILVHQLKFSSLVSSLGSNLFGSGYDGGIVWTYQSGHSLAAGNDAITILTPSVSTDPAITINRAGIWRLDYEWSIRFSATGAPSPADPLWAEYGGFYWKWPTANLYIDLLSPDAGGSWWVAKSGLTMYGDNLVSTSALVRHASGSRVLKIAAGSQLRFVCKGTLGNCQFSVARWDINHTEISPNRLTLTWEGPAETYETYSS